MDESTELEQLGQFFHDFRVGRGLTLKEAAGNWSAATLYPVLNTERSISVLKRQQD